MDKNFIIINGIIFDESVKILNYCNKISNTYYLVLINNSRETHLYFHPIRYSSKKPCIQTAYTRNRIKALNKNN